MAEPTVYIPQNSPMALLRQAGMLIGIAASVALGAYVVMWSRTPNYSMLYSDLNERDLTQIVNELQTAQIPFKINHDAGSILVASANLDDARMKLASAGLPHGATAGFESLNQDPGFGTTQFLERARYQHSIEAELSRSIAKITNVRSARVQLAMPPETAFARTRRDPSASVFLDLYAGRRVEPQQVAAITHLVSASVPNLASERVTVIDQNGSLLTDESADGDVRLATRHFEMTQRLEKSMADRIEHILQPMVGMDGVRAQVTAELDFTDSEHTSETREPDQAAVLSESKLEEEHAGAGSGGVPGALSNTPPGTATAPEQTAANAQQNPPGAAPNAQANAKQETPRTKRVQSTTNYQPNVTISHVRPPQGEVRHLSVAVVVRNPAPAAKEAPKEGDAAKPAETPKAAFTQEQLDRMTNLVKNAIGYRADRGDVVTLTSEDFVAPPAPEPIPDIPMWKQPWMWDVSKQVLGGLFALVLVFGVLRPAMKNLMGKPVLGMLPGADGQAGLPGPGGTAALPATAGEAQQRMLPGVAGGSALEQAKQVAASDPRVAAQVIKGWVGD
ncbi:MAG: flagellar M-ring protein FliF [Gammaproteobacteria bacterium]|nr:flagellar M-ring protein FliF [Gammaproteobacteria bacterium]MBI5615833.1 flagellar M-ring protein FliF [Gammaproteobacteria bacterium]